MSVQIVKNSAALADLEDWGVVKSPLSEPPCRLRGTRQTLPERQASRAGIWECTPGTYRREVVEGEVMHILSGECTFTPDNEQPIRIEAGDTVFCSPNTTGIWNIQSTMRKVFVLIP